MSYEENGMKFHSDDEFDSMSDATYEDEFKGAQIRMFLDKGYTYETAVFYAENHDKYLKAKSEARAYLGIPFY